MIITETSPTPSLGEGVQLAVEWSMASRAAVDRIIFLEFNSMWLIM